MSLEQAIRAWDGKSADSIEAVYLRHEGESGFAESLVELSGRPELETGATWLLKRHLERGGRLGDGETAALFALASDLQSWEARLHLLQGLLYLRIPEAERQPLETFVRGCLTDPNKFVRAWAYNGFYELARQYPQYREEAGKLFEMAMRDEAASVKARVRNIMQQGF